MNDIIGRDEHQLESNINAYNRQLLFGFSGIQYNEYGWFDIPMLLDREVIPICNGNEIRIGRGLNDKWSYGLSYSTGNAGGGFRDDIWGKIIDSKEECIVEALKEVKKLHLRQKQDKEKYGDSCGNYNKKKSEEAVEIVDKMLSELDTNNKINPNTMIKLKKTKTFSVSEQQETISIDGIDYPIANLLKSGIVNQTTVLVGYNDLWNEINVLDLGLDNSDLNAFKNYIEEFNITLVDLGIIKETKKDYSLKHQDFEDLEKQFPMFDYIQISKLSESLGEHSSIYMLKVELQQIANQNKTIAQWLQEKQELKQKTMENLEKKQRFENRSKQLIDLGFIADITKELLEFVGNGFIVSENSVDNDTDEEWNELIAKLSDFTTIPEIPNPIISSTIPSAEELIGKQVTLDESIKEVSEEIVNEVVKTADEFTQTTEVVTLESIGTLTPDKINDLRGLKESQEAIVIANPLVIVKDKKTLDLAKKQRAVLLKASTAIDGKDGIEANAKKYLNQFKKTIENFLSPLSKITRDAYDKQNAEIVKYEKAEELRILAEQQAKLKKIEERTNQLFAIPMTFNGSLYQIGTVYILPSQIELATDDEFSILVNQAKAVQAAIEQAKQATLQAESDKDRLIRELQDKLKAAGLLEEDNVVIPNPVLLEVNAPEVVNTAPQATPSQSTAPAQPQPAPTTPVQPQQVQKMRFKANEVFIESNSNNTVLQKFDTEHIDIIGLNPMPPAFIKCRSYYMYGNREVALKLHEIMSITDPTVKKSEKIIELISSILNQKM